MTAVLAITVSPSTTPDTFLSDAVTGKVLFHTERGNGTFRRVHFLADGTKEREIAEWVADQREQGVTMRKIAAELHMSVPSVRRMINDLILTEEFEQMDTEELEEIIQGAAEAEVTGEEMDFTEDNTETADAEADAEGAMQAPLGE